MKITKQQLKQIIKEEIEATLDEAGYFDPNREPGEGYPFGKPLPGLRGALKDFVPKSMAHAVDQRSEYIRGDGATRPPVIPRPTGDDTAPSEWEVLKYAKTATGDQGVYMEKATG